MPLPPDEEACWATKAWLLCPNPTWCRAGPLMACGCGEADERGEGCQTSVDMVVVPLLHLLPHSQARCVLLLLLCAILLKLNRKERVDGGGGG